MASTCNKDPWNCNAVPSRKQSRIRAHWCGAYNAHSWWPRWCEHRVLQKLAPKLYCGRNSVYLVRNDLTDSPQLLRKCVTLTLAINKSWLYWKNCYNDDSNLVNGKHLFWPQNFLVFSSNFQAWQILQAQIEGKGDNSDWCFMYMYVNSHDDWGTECTPDL